MTAAEGRHEQEASEIKAQVLEAFAAAQALGRPNPTSATAKMLNKKGIPAPDGRPYWTGELVLVAILGRRYLARRHLTRAQWRSQTVTELRTMWQLTQSTTGCMELAVTEARSRGAAKPERTAAQDLNDAGIPVPAGARQAHWTGPRVSEWASDDSSGT